MLQTAVSTVSLAVWALLLRSIAGAQTHGVPEDSIVGRDFLQYVSTGWFPIPYTATGYYVGSTINIYQHSSAQNLRTAGTVPIVGTWSAANPFRRGENDIKKSWSNDDADDDFPPLGYSVPLILRVQQNIPFLRCIIRLDAMYEMSRDRLFSLDTSRQYLSLSGQPTRFREVSVLFNNEHFLGARLGVTIPVYGAFVTSEPIRLDTLRSLSIDRLASFYYFGASIHGAVLVLSEATQYVQIADAKSSLRYANGQDTVTLMQKARLSTAQPLRLYADVAAGWQATFGVFSFAVEAYVALPLRSVLTDARWMLTRFGIRTAIGWER
ncbi:MAG: hypothetical protein RMK00_05925 [Bacteroidota bacterium]|nr:hypothetical protein [Bacteroidota bacterium]